MNTIETIMDEAKHPYDIDAELGRIEVTTHVLKNTKDGKVVFSIADDYFEPKNPMHRFLSPCMEELMLRLSSSLSFRETDYFANRIRHEGEGIKTTTLRNTVERQGKSINKAQHNKAEEALLANGFTSGGEIKPDTEVCTAEPKTIDENIVKAIAAGLELSMDIQASDYEDPAQTVNISADDVLVDRQASNRPNSPEKGQKKRLSNTVIHVQKDKKAYIINNDNIKGAFKLLMGFLFTNSLAAFINSSFLLTGRPT